jgi:zinc/manganese transport system substrate-binding protein
MRPVLSLLVAGMAALLWLLVAGMAALLPAPALSHDKVNVAASFTILADFARNVGGDRIAVTSLIGPDADVHTYTPSPADAKRIADAKVIIVNGLGLEGSTERFMRAAAKAANIVVASAGVSPLRMNAEVDPHAWQAVGNAKIYVTNIRDELIAADPAYTVLYEANSATYLRKLDALDADVKAAIANIPPERRRLITSHDAFGYFGKAYGIALIALNGVSTEGEPSAREMDSIITQIRREKIPAVFLENVTDPRLLQRIASESGARIGGTLYTDALSKPDGPAPTYIHMIRHNLTQLTAALGP